MKKLDPVPDYLGGILTGDFPTCPVLIDGEFWVIHRCANWSVYRFKGTNIENMTLQPDGHVGPFPVSRPYMLGGMWYDDAEKKLYAPLHCELTGGYEPIHRQVHLATSMDKGLTWHYEGPIITRDDHDGALRSDSEYSGLYWDGGNGDFFIYVDTLGGYIYLYPDSCYWAKPGAPEFPGFCRHQVARCAISDKMAPGKWRKFYNGAWNEPGLGGKASYVNAYYVMYNTYLQKYISFNYNSSLSFCSDLSKQDWSPCFKIPGNAWGCGPSWSDGAWAWHVTDTDKINIFTGGQSLRLYSYFRTSSTVQQTSGEVYRIDFGSGKTTGNAGYYAPGVFLHDHTTMDPMQLYSYEPQFESADPIESRRTRRVGSDSPELTCSGDWSSEGNDAYYEKTARVSVTKGNSIEFAFKGADIYWRAWKAEDCGKADVYLDNVLQRTVDCFATPATGYQFAFVKTGLDANVTHTIKIVVRGDKNSLSSGTAIKHMLFEYSAESYRASDGFSGVQGKNGWYYQQKEDAQAYEGHAGFVTPGYNCKDNRYNNLKFANPNWMGFELLRQTSVDENAAVSYFHMTPGIHAAVRVWVAPRSGAVRLEGRVFLENAGGDDAGRDGVRVSILRNAALPNAAEIWPARLVKHGEPVSYDMIVDVARGDALYFIVGKQAVVNRPNTDQVSVEAVIPNKSGTDDTSGVAKRDRATWDPIITYVY